ncbi:hypothetical protein [Novosphingobium sp.]|uniref:hypothetical protein n=1 Tax=Novosphingobium sp. TaxID=1874826 RepID=UPI0026114A17|nr:hypothetical protein [Novosphingobium sp.]
MERVEDSAPGLLGVIGLDRAIDIKADRAVPPLEDTQEALATNETSEMGHGALCSRSRAGHMAPDQANSEHRETEPNTEQPWKEQNAERVLQSLTEVLEKSSAGVCSTEASADPVATSTIVSTQPENNCKDIGGGERGQKRQSEILPRLGA